MTYALGGMPRHGLRWSAARCLASCLYGVSPANFFSDALGDVQANINMIVARDAKAPNHSNINIAIAFSRVGKSDVAADVFIQRVGD